MKVMELGEKLKEFDKNRSKVRLKRNLYDRHT